MSKALATVPLEDGAVRRLFDEPEFRVAKPGYHPDDVVAFLDDLGARMVNLLERLRSAEQVAGQASQELDDYRTRAKKAESSRDLFERTLALAEETASAAVADAKERAEQIQADAEHDARRRVDETRLRIDQMMDAARSDVQRIYADERRAIAEAKAGARRESDQLETLRLAVAAETMALEEVRNELRRRIRRAATDLLGVAESPDGLGAPVTRGIPDVVARQMEKDEVGGPTPPAEMEGSPMTAAVGPGSPGPAEATDDSPSGTDTPAVVSPSIDLVEVEGAASLVSGPESTEAGAEPVAHTAGPGADTADGEADPAGRGADPAGPEAAEATDEAEPGDAFDRFMSDEIEEEPSRSWILT